VPRQRLAGEIPSPVWKVGESPARALLVDIGGGHFVAQAAAPGLS